ncbi:MAG: hypothetical protein K2X81_02750 [Candidatus Obscuribacterales bacterium]|nr:hypothetical protein [Candidatus Obscuribacterales bacterium]
MYKRAMSKRECQPCKHRANAEQRTVRHLALVNEQGDSYRQNKLGQITDFMQRQSDKTYSFEYTESGALASISSSDGWSWSCGKDVWTVRNYFDTWTVSKTDCEAVNVTQNGMEAVGRDPSQMGLPLR